MAARAAGALSLRLRAPVHVQARALLGGLLGSLLGALLLAGCDNNPWPREAAATNTLFTGVIENSPRHLRPTASYWNNDTPFTYQIYEPLSGYHYLKRPYRLVPNAAAAVVQPHYVDDKGQPLPEDAPAEKVAESIYEVPIKPGIRYQPHPAFAVDEQGRYRYHALKPGELGRPRRRAGRLCPRARAPQAQLHAGGGGAAPAPGASRGGKGFERPNPANFLG